jgi:hypothetical protein
MFGRFAGAAGLAAGQGACHRRAGVTGKPSTITRLDGSLPGSR